MVISYKHLRIKYIYTSINIWTNHTQYYRTLLRAHSICMPSIIQYMLVYNNNSNRIEFKSRQLANIIGKFVYYYIKYIKIYSYFYIYFKKIIDTKKLKKVYNYKYYKGKQLIFTLNLKHLILLIRNKIKIKFRNNRFNLWKLFYNIPNNFWNNSAKKRIKSIIWSIFFIKNNPNYKTPKHYLKKNEISKGNLFFFNYNKISNLVYNAFIRKRIPKKEWLAKKNIEKKKKRKRKFGIYFNSNINDDTFIDINKINIYKNTYNSIYKINNYNNDYKFDTNNLYSIVGLYYYLLFFVKLSNTNNIYLNLYYLYISNILNDFKNKYIIHMYHNYNKNNILYINSNNTFNLNMWYHLFMKEHNTYTYFNINSILLYKQKLYVDTSNILLLPKTLNNIFFIKKNILLPNSVHKKIYIYKKYSNRKYLSKHKRFMRKRIHLNTTKSIIYKTILYNRNTYKKIINTKSFREINNKKIHNHKIIKKYIFRKKFYNKFKKIIKNIYYNKKNKYFLTNNSKFNNKINILSLYNTNNYFKKIQKLNNINKIIYCRYTYNNNNIKNNIVIYKQLKKNIYNNLLIQNKIGLDIKIMYNNKLLYSVFFNNNIIYKEMINEYNIRIHNKNNKYDHFFLLHKHIIIFINKKKNISNITNGIYLFKNCFYINNKISFIPLLYNINKYTKLLITSTFINTNKYNKLISNN